MKKKFGFTLIELSIVLVIIGLIVGGVLVGNDLIKAGQLRSLISQQDSIQAAAVTFKLKYNCLAGDCNKASTFGMVTPTTTTPISIDGNGDRVVAALDGYFFAATGATTGPATLGNETIMFWEHLYQAKLIPSYTFPTTSYASYSSNNWPVALQPYGFGIPANGPAKTNSWQAGYADGTNGQAWATPSGFRALNSNAIFLYGTNTRCAIASCGGSRYAEALLPEEARAIDTKVDDSLPWTGAVQAIGGGNYIDNIPLHPASYSAPNLCVAGNALASEYAPSATNNMQTCNLAFKLSVR